MSFLVENGRFNVGGQLKITAWNKGLTTKKIINIKISQALGNSFNDNCKIGLE